MFAAGKQILATSPKPEVNGSIKEFLRNSLVKKEFPEGQSNTESRNSLGIP